MINNLEEPRSLKIGLYFQGLLSPLAWSRVIALTDRWIEAHAGLSFKDEVSCGLMKRETYTTKQKLKQHLLKKAPTETDWDHDFFITALDKGSQERWPFNRFFIFTYGTARRHLDTRYMGLTLKIEYPTPFPLTKENMLELLKEWIALVQAEGYPIKYGTLHFYKKFSISRRDKKVQADIPDHKLMGVVWGNLLTDAHLGEQRDGVLTTINEAIAPEKVVSLSPGLYWFNFPFDIAEYNQAKDIEYHAMRQRVIEALKPYKILWRGGTRVEYD